MKTKLILLLLVIQSAFCLAQKKPDIPSDELMSNIGFRPVDPINYTFPIGYFTNSETYFNYLIGELEMSEDEVRSILTKDDLCFTREDRNIYFSDMPRERVMDLLPNETVEVQISEVTRQGGLTLKGTAALSAKNSSYQITMDYIKYVTINVVDQDEFTKDGALKNMKIISYARVGVGLRLVASIRTKKKGVNLGDLFAIGFAASKGEVIGSLSVNVLGIESRETTSLLPMPSEISASTIQNAMQAMATIKSKLYDKDVELRPQIISIRSVVPQISTDELVLNTSQVLAMGRTSLILTTNSEILNYAPGLLKCPD